jgi:hypothetical protein
MPQPYAEFVDWMLAVRKRVESKGKPLFLGIPDHWYDKPGPKYRCANDHVSTTILKSEVKGDLCLACMAPVMMTFPEDKDGPPPPLDQF